jgi:hypothetical protein
MVIAGIIVGTAVGFGLGLVAFKVKSRWCPTCGAWTYRYRPGDVPERSVP